MTRAVAGSLLLLAGVCQAATPVDKVISLLTKLSSQVQAEGVAEAASYDKFACFCKDRADAKVYEIAKSDKKIKELDADITELQGEITSLDDDVATNKKEVEKQEKTQTDNKKARGGDAKTYGEKRKSLEEAIQAVSDALETMRNSRDDVQKEVDSLLQKPVFKQSPALALIAGAAAGKRFGQPKGKATSYQYASKEVIATLTSLTATFKKQLQELDQAEINAVGDYEMAAGARSNTISALQKEINEKETLSASKGEQKSDKDEQKTQETKARNADQGFLDDLTAKCEAKATAWDKRSTTRASELTALTQAVELLKGMGGLYSTNTKLVGLISKPAIVKHAPAFFQLRSARRESTDEAKLQQLTSRLNAKAHSLKSTSLAMVALQLQSVGPDHFVKVRGIIKDLIKKLEDDAKAEATSKSLCDKNMKAAVEKRDKTNADAETASAQIESTSASINTLKKDIADLSQEIADHNKELLEAQELRGGEKVDNEKAIANSDSGKAAVDSAITLLKKFYEGALVQKSSQPKTDRDGKAVSDGAPATFDESEEYKGKADSSKGIIGMLEVIASDFERTSKAVTDAEATAVKDFNEFKADSEKTIKEKSKLKGEKETEVKTKGSDLTGFKGDLKDSKKMNEEAIEELEKLQASCVDTGESYEERAKHRKEEIEALKQAMQILEDWGK